MTAQPRLASRAVTWAVAQGSLCLPCPAQQPLHTAPSSLPSVEGFTCPGKVPGLCPRKETATLQPGPLCPPRPLGLVLDVGRWARGVDLGYPEGRVAGDLCGHALSQAYASLRPTWRGWLLIVPHQIGMLSGVRWLSASALSPVRSPDLTLPPSTLPVGLALLRCLCQMPISGCVCVCVVGAGTLQRGLSDRPGGPSLLRVHQGPHGQCAMGSVYEDQHWLPGAAAPTYHNLGA